MTKEFQSGGGFTEHSTEEAPDITVVQKVDFCLPQWMRKKCFHILKFQIFSYFLAISVTYWCLKRILFHLLVLIDTVWINLTFLIKPQTPDTDPTRRYFVLEPPKFLISKIL